jgi:hypothetical protein
LTVTKSVVSNAFGVTRIKAEGRASLTKAQASRVATAAKVYLITSEGRIEWDVSKAGLAKVVDPSIEKKERAANLEAWRQRQRDRVADVCKAKPSSEAVREFVIGMDSQSVFSDEVAPDREVCNELLANEECAIRSTNDAKYDEYLRDIVARCKRTTKP